LADDVDHAIHRVCAPQGRARAADDFDAIDVLEHEVDRVPVGHGGQRVVDLPAIDQHEVTGGRQRAAGQAARTGDPAARVDATDIHARHQPERFDDRARAAAAQVLVRYHV